MKLKWAVSILSIIFLAAQASAAGTPVLNTDKDKGSYALGVDLARNLKRQGIAPGQAEAIANGVRDELSGGKLLMSEQELQAALNAYQTELKQRRAQPVKAASEANKKDGEVFLAENKMKPGVVTLPSGLQYKILKEGDGKKPTEKDIVEVNYRGTYIDGTEFENTYKRGQPVNLKVTGGIRGFTEALKLMPVGSKWQIFVPPELAYGQKGLGRKIAPNATLIFDVELLGIK
jgi:UDP-GlcNAc:undecaprenyl-phosphate/decaprenyl-phosphate GlcNAc-1-phosphate transferase